MKRIAIALVLCGTLVALCGAAWGAGLNNAGFEEGFTGGIGNSWIKYTMMLPSPTSLTFADSTTIKHGGAHAQKIVAAASNTEGGIYQQLPTVINQVYTVKVWVYSLPAADGLAGAYLGVDPKGLADPTGASVIWYQASAVNQWIQITNTFTAKANYASVFLDNWSTTVYFDDAEPAAPPIPEPSSLLALASGLIGFAGVIRKRI